MRRFLCFFLSLAVAAGLCVIPALADEECPHTDTGWQQISDGCALVCYDCGSVISEEQPHEWIILGVFEDEEDFEIFGCEGTRHRSVMCKRCECFSGIEIEPLGHKYVNGVCERCGESCPHSKTRVEGAGEASCTAEGFTGKTICEECGTTVSEGTSIPAAGHKTSVVGQKDPTCSEEGYTGDTKCDVCGEVTEQGTAIPKADHHYVDGLCEYCGEQEPIADYAPETTDAPKEDETEAPAEDPTKEAEDDQTGAPEVSSTQAPERNDVKKDGKSGCGNVIGGGFVAIIGLAAAAFVLRKKH